MGVARSSYYAEPEAKPRDESTVAEIHAIAADCSSRSATSRPPRPRNATTPNWRPAPWRRRTQMKLPPGKPERFRAQSTCTIEFAHFLIYQPMQ